ncbi:MAG: hypothetical protein WAX84_01100, partial [Leptotrichiaceae bacterium]
MRKLKSKVISTPTNDVSRSYTKEKVTKYNKRILLLGWLIPFFALFLVHIGRKKMPEQTKKILCEILNLEFTASLVLTLYVSGLNTFLLLVKNRNSPLLFIILFIFIALIALFVTAKAIAT